MRKQPKRFLTIAYAVLFLAPVLLAAAAIYPPPDLAAEELSLGQRLEVRIWDDIKEKRIATIESKIAPGFISVHSDGARNREEELELIKGLNLDSYRLTDFTVTREGPTMIVSYTVSVEETIEGKRLSKEPAARLSVWLMTAKGWQWIAHANLKPLKEQEN